MELTIGKRIAQLRQAKGWTQQAVADRCAISRVAISHIEMDLTLPSERTVTLLAGLFQIAPIDLVADTTYPEAKAIRLPAVVNVYSELDLQLALLENDLAWLDTLQQPELALTVRNRWWPRLGAWQQAALDARERTAIAAARQRLQAACASISAAQAGHTR